MIRLTYQDRTFRVDCPKCSTETSRGLVIVKIDFTNEGCVKGPVCVNCGYRPPFDNALRFKKKGNRKPQIKNPDELMAA